MNTETTFKGSIFKAHLKSNAQVFSDEGNVKFGFDIGLDGGGSVIEGSVTRSYTIMGVTFSQTEGVIIGGFGYGIGAKFITNPGNGKVFQAKVFNNIATGVAGRKIGFEISF